MVIETKSHILLSARWPSRKARGVVQSKSEGLRTGGIGDKSPGRLLEAQEPSMQRSEGGEALAQTERANSTFLFF